MIDSGQLNRPITILASGTIQDATGQESTTFTVLYQTWASIRTLTSREVYALGAGYTAQVTHKITLRYPAATVTAGMQVVSRDRTFLVQTAQDPDDQRVQLDLICQEQQK